MLSVAATIRRSKSLRSLVNFALFSQAKTRDYCATPSSDDKLRNPVLAKNSFVRSRSTLGVKNIVNQLESANGTEEIWKILDDAAEVLSGPAGTYWLSLLDALQRVKRRELLVEVFYWKRKLVYRSNDPREYAKLIIFAGRLSCPDFGHEILNYMCAKGLKRNATIYNSLIDAQCKNQNIEKALSLYNQMKESRDCQPTLVTYNILISFYSKIPSLDDMENMFHACKLAGFAPDRVTLNSLIGGYMKCKRFDKMEEIYQQMIVSDIQPNMVTFNYQIIGYSQSGMLNEMEAVLNNMQNAGLQINATIGEVMVEAYSGKQMLDKMEAVIEVMDNTPNVRYGSRVHSMMIETYAKVGKLDRVEYSITRMFCDKRMFASGNTIDMVISAFCKQGCFSRLEQILQQVRDSGWTFNHSTYMTLIIEYGKYAMYHKMEEVFCEMNKPTEEIYRVMCDTYHKAGKNQELLKWVQQMSEAGFDPGNDYLKPKK